MTLAEEFEGYIACVYDGSLSGDDLDEAHREQRSQLKNAFYAGCLVAHVNDADLTPELRAHRERLREGAAASLRLPQ